MTRPSRGWARLQHRVGHECPEWTREERSHQEDTDAIALGDRIRALRKEAGWSQAEVAERIGVDSGRVSRYESGRLTPTADALVRLAETLNVSIDHLLIDDIPRRRLHNSEDALGDRLASLGELGHDDLHLVTSLIDAFVTKNRLRALAGDIN